jgi:glutaredoxin
MPPPARERAMRYWVLALALAAAFTWQHRDTVQSWLYPPQPLVVNPEHKVVLFATSWCGYCAKTRELLRRNNIPYLEYDIEKSATGFAHFQRLSGTGVPLLLIGTRVIHGFDERAIRAALQ